MVWTTEIVEFLLNNNILHNLKESPYLANNKGFRKPNLYFEFTDNEKFEYCRCKTDVIYFAENYCMLHDERIGMFAPILLTDVQKHILMNQDKISVHESDRQSGISTAYAILILHACTFNSNYVVSLIDYKLECSNEQLSRIKEFYTNLPFFLKNGIEKTASNYIIFDNYSKIVISSSKNLMKGFSPNLYIVQSAEYYTERIFREILNYLIPITSVRKDRLIIQHSGNEYFYDNIFYSSWVDAIKNAKSSINYLDCKGKSLIKMQRPYGITKNLQVICCDTLNALMAATKLDAKDLRKITKDC